MTERLWWVVGGEDWEINRDKVKYFLEDYEKWDVLIFNWCGPINRFPASWSVSLPPP